MDTSNSDGDRALRGLGWTRVGGPIESRTEWRPGKAKSRWAALALVLAFAGPARGGGPPAWPSFLGPRDRFPPDLVAAVEHVWLEPTLSRTVSGRPARVPFRLYAAFVDAPDVTAAAARFLRLARYEVEPLDGDWYRATDNDGSRGIYKVLVREPTRRVILSWGEHSGSILGTISGSALSVLEFTPDDEGVGQALTAYVRIDNAFAARLARVLVAIFGHLADRKLAEGFTVTARVAEWAIEHPGEFCGWLAREPFPPARRERLLATLPACS